MGMPESETLHLVSTPRGDQDLLDLDLLDLDLVDLDLLDLEMALLHSRNE